jgi:signal transduction histidine kinase
MRQQLVRSSFVAVLFSVLVMGLPLALAGWWIMLGKGERLRGWLDQPDLPMVPVKLLGVIAVLSVIAVLVGLAVASLQARRYAEPMAQLVDRAERYGAGESRFQPLVTGIAEIDRIAEVLARSALQMTRSLASERDFASDASHQLRTPLTALLMRLEEISMTDDLEVVNEEAGIAIAQVERLTKVVDELLSRSRRGHDAPPPSVSLDSVIAALQREWQPAFEQARRSVRVHGQRGLSVRATPVALSQVLSTLLENSLAHGRGTVDVQARRSGPSVVVEVSDQGEGVPSTIAPHIFERSVSTAQSSGLGLALARDLAEANGGRLELIQAQPAIFALFLSEADPGPHDRPDGPDGREERDSELAGTHREGIASEDELAV